ncbi:MAG: cation diffusion facilitator family transporter [Holophagaceae bacterium]|nr:cation diffusion facilitator family transporter [Holophagaceae bacterium]
MSHDHSHDHALPTSRTKVFALAIGLNLTFVLVEWVFGILSHSLALIADAGHNLSDVMGLALAWAAVGLARREPSDRFTYGLGRSSILAALFNAMLLMAAIGAISWEAVRRITSPSPIQAGTVIWVAAAGIVLNTGTALLFLKDRHHDLNLRGAFLHMAMDALVSLGVVIGGFLVIWTGWNWVDPVLSLLISLVILVGTWDLLKKSFVLTLDGVPHAIDLPEVREFLVAWPGVCQIHDLHVWAMSTTENALSVHLVMETEAIEPDLAELGHQLHHRFHIDHPTFQVEWGDPLHPCRHGHR